MDEHRSDVDQEAYAFVQAYDRLGRLAGPGISEDAIARGAMRHAAAEMREARFFLLRWSRAQRLKMAPRRGQRVRESRGRATRRAARRQRVGARGSPSRPGRPSDPEPPLARRIPIGGAA